ncbi:MAG TPA: MFS transporter [Isosphaeraceae bacterium]
MFHRDDETGPETAAPGVLARRARLTFAVLFAMNLLDYVDRWALSGVLSKLQPDLGLDDAQAGALSAYFLVSYSLVSPLMGWAGDRTRRTRLLALGVGVWSLATIGTGLSRNYGELRLARSLLGLGEATYGVLAPALLMDLYPRERRSRVLSSFYLAMPIGYALGVILGGRIAEATGNWRLAFFVVGAPGLAAALAALWLPEPTRGASEGVDPERLRAHERAGPRREDYLELMVNSSYTYTVFGLAAYTFAFGGLAYWLPSYLERVQGLPKGQAVDILGITGLGAAIVGMSGGGWLADRLARVTPKALFLVSGTSMLLAVPCVLMGLFARSVPGIVTWLFLAQMLMFANTGPSNAVIANVVAPNMRATAYAVSTFAIHFLGDVWSPYLMGRISILCGQPDTMATPLGRALAAVGMRPVDGTNLGAGMLVVVPAVLIGGLVLLAGTRHLPREMALMLARLRAAPASARGAG